MITDEKVKELSLMANQVRQSIISSLLLAKSGHSAGPLGMADIFTYLYFHAMRHDANRPDWAERDRIILSNGHICPVLYAVMAHAGYFPVEELKTLRKLGSRLQGHPHREWLPYVETSSGPLGSGLSQAAGMALADKIDFGQTSTKKFYAMLSDGELQEGNSWEAIMFAAKYKLHNLIAIVDYNNIQIEGYVEDVMPLAPLAEKWRSFNWHVIEVDGHDFRAIDTAVEQAKTIFEKPIVILA
ncbi:MAG: transketolase, partial [Candidatus Pacebacteria bacterium]|nr:transketolase [Candidatus Paceibacterota bacterium]